MYHGELEPLMTDTSASSISIERRGLADNVRKKILSKISIFGSVPEPSTYRPQNINMCPKIGFGPILDQHKSTLGF